jgi:hypothetical protein
MAAMQITLELKPFRLTEVYEADQTAPEFVDDLDVLVESAVCSCNAGDDNPY